MSGRQLGVTQELAYHMQVGPLGLKKAGEAVTSSIIEADLGTTDGDPYFFPLLFMSVGVDVA